MAARVVTSVPVTLSGTVTLPVIGVVTGVSTSYSLLTVRTTAAATTTPARVRTTTSPTTTAVRTTPTSSTVVSSSSVVTSSSSSSSSSSVVPSTASQGTISRTSSSSSSTTRTTSSATRTSSSSSARSSSASSASASVAAGAASKGDSSALSPLARSLIIAAAVVGGVILVALTIAFVMRRMRRKRRHEDDLGSELQESPSGGGKGGWGGAAAEGYGAAATNGAWGVHDETPYHEKTVGAGAAGFGSGSFVAALGRNERPVSPAPPNHPGGLYAGGYAASDVSLHGQPLGADGSNMYGVDVGGQNYNNLGHGYPPGSPYYTPQQGQAAPGQYFPNQQQQQLYGNGAYGEYPAAPSTVALASGYADQSYDNLPAGQAQYAPEQPAPAPPTAVSPMAAIDAPTGLPEGATLMRVVRGFQATLSDELQIQPFTTLALLQTYDDGWCLCEDLETHQQGVVPRDCLAAPELVNGQMETGARALTPSAGAPASPAAAGPSSSSASASSPAAAAPTAPSSAVEEKRALAAAAALGSQPSQADEPSPVPYAEEDPNAARPLPTLPPPSFSESNLFAQASGQPPLAANEYPREKAAAAAVAQPPPQLDMDFGPPQPFSAAAPASPGAASSSAASGSRIPRIDTFASLAPSDRQERRSSLMDSVRAAGAYLEGNGTVSTTHRGQ